MSPVRLVAVCFSTATLLFSSQMVASADPANRFYSHWQRSDAIALLVVVLAVTAAAVALAQLAVRRGGPGARRLLRWLLVLALAEAGLGHLVRITDDPARWLRWGVPLVALAALCAALFVAERRVYRAAVVVALLLSPLGVILLGQLLAAPPVDTRPLVQVDVGEVRARASRPPIVLVIFDDWSWFRSSANDSFLESLPNLRALAATSFHFTNARSPGPHTVESIPELIAEAQPRSLADLPKDPWWVDDGPAAEAAPEPRLFTQAARAGYTTSLIGFYLPYRELVGEAVTEVSSEPHVPKGQTFVGKMGFVVVRSLESMGDPALRWIGRWFGERAYNRHWYAMNRRIRARVMQRLGALEPGTLLLAHFALPHSPFVFSAEGDYQGDSAETRMERSPEKYAVHIRYVDRLVGEMVSLLRERGTFDDAMLIITSDHNWVTEPVKQLREQRTVVPLVIKWPGQREGARVSTRICLVGLQVLLGRVEGDPVTVVPGLAELEGMARGTCR